MSKVFITPHPDFIVLAKELSKSCEIITVSKEFIDALTNVDVNVIDLNSVLSQKQLISIRIDSLLLTSEIVNKLPNKSEFLPDESKSAVLLDKSGVLVADIGRRINDFVAIVKCLDSAKPDMVIVHNDVDNTTRTIALWAKANNVPCLHIPHSIYLDTNERPKDDVHSHLSASHSVASGPFHAEWLVNNGMKPENVFITGIPTFDKVSKKYNVDHMRRLLKVNPNFPVVTYMSSWRQDTNLLGCHTGVEDTYINFLESAKKLIADGIQVIVKCHPSGNNVSWHVSEAGKHGVRCIVTDKHLGPIVSVSNIIVSYGPSNVVIESAIMNPDCGLIAINGFYSDKEVVSISEKDDMYTAIVSELSFVTDKSSFIKKYVSYPDGKSIDRIIKVVGEILESSS